MAFGCKRLSDYVLLSAFVGFAAWKASRSPYTPLILADCISLLAPLFPLRLCSVLPDYFINTLGRHTAAGF
jgi:hypothetical protein